MDHFSAAWHQVASQILYLNSFSETLAKNAYCSLLLSPDLFQLRFSKLLQQAKRKWNTSTPKYSTFWGVHEVLASFARKPIAWNSIESVRNRLYLVFMVLQLLGVLT